MLFHWDIESEINRIMAIENIEDIKISNNTNSPMSFSPALKTINYNRDSLNRYSLCFPYIPPTSFVALGFYHELGHYYSYNQSSTHTTKDRIQKELLAWKIGRRLITNQSDKRLFDILNKVNIAKYVSKDKYYKLLSDGYIKWLKDNYSEAIVEISISEISKKIKYRKNPYRKENKAEFIDLILNTLSNDLVFQTIHNPVNDTEIVLMSNGLEKYVISLNYYGDANNHPEGIYRLII